MFKQTVLLFIKAIIIGVLINVGLAQTPNTSNSPENDVSLYSNTAIEQPANVSAN